MLTAAHSTMRHASGLMELVLREPAIRAEALVIAMKPQLEGQAASDKLESILKDLCFSDNKLYAISSRSTLNTLEDGKEKVFERCRVEVVFNDNIRLILSKEESPSGETEYRVNLWNGCPINGLSPYDGKTALARVETLSKIIELSGEQAKDFYDKFHARAQIAHSELEAKTRSSIDRILSGDFSELSNVRPFFSGTDLKKAERQGYLFDLPGSLRGVLAVQNSDRVMSLNVWRPEMMLPFWKTVNLMEKDSQAVGKAYLRMLEAF